MVFSRIREFILGRENSVLLECGEEIGKGFPQKNHLFSCRLFFIFKWVYSQINFWDKSHESNLSDFCLFFAFGGKRVGTNHYLLRRSGNRCTEKRRS